MNLPIFDEFISWSENVGTIFSYWNMTLIAQYIATEKLYWVRMKTYFFELLRWRWYLQTKLFDNIIDSHIFSGFFHISCAKLMAHRKSIFLDLFLVFFQWFCLSSLLLMFLIFLVMPLLLLLFLFHYNFCNSNRVLVCLFWQDDGREFVGMEMLFPWPIYENRCKLGSYLLI